MREEVLHKDDFEVINFSKDATTGQNDDGTYEFRIRGLFKIKGKETPGIVVVGVTKEEFEDPDFTLGDMLKDFEQRDVRIEVNKVSE